MRYVARTKAPILLEDATDSTTMIFSSPQTKQFKSILCVPILNQSKLVAILYVDNNQMTGTAYVYFFSNCLQEYLLQSAWKLWRCLALK